MATDGTSSTILKRVLAKEDLEKLPNDIRKKYEEFFSEFLEMKALYETQRMNLGKQRLTQHSYYELKGLKQKYR